MTGQLLIMYSHNIGVSNVGVVGNVGDNSVGSYRLHASETQQLADATPICYLCGVARGMQSSTNDGPTCNNLSDTTVKM